MFTIITVIFESYDYHWSEESINEIIDKCKKLCEVFNFEFELNRMDVEETAIIFSVSFIQDLLTQQHYMNILAAFAQEYQINLAQAHLTQEASFD